MEAQKHIKQLGLIAEDLVTGKKGVITSVAFDLYGCIQVILTTQINETSNESNQEWYDVARLKILNKRPVMKQPDFDFGDVAKGKKGGFIKPLM